MSIDIGKIIGNSISCGLTRIKNIINGVCSVYIQMFVLQDSKSQSLTGTVDKKNLKCSLLDLILIVTIMQSCIHTVITRVKWYGMFDMQ